MDISKFFKFIDNFRKMPALAEPYNRIWKYISAGIVISLALFCDLHFKTFHGYPSILLFAGVIFSTWYSGFGPGLVAIVFAVLSINYYFIAPSNAFNYGAASFLPQSIAFTFAAILISSLVESQRRAEEMVYKLMERKKRFIADASHELFTPLSIIKTQSEVLLQSQDTDLPSFREVTAVNINEVNRMTKIVENLLELSLNEFKTQSPVSKQVELADLAKQILTKLKVLADGKNIKLNMISEARGKINGDAAALTHLIINLLQNAIQYTNQGGNITMGVYDTGKGIELAVEDDGIGIPAEHLPYIFEPFYKSDNARSRRAGGAGLGLSIVKSVADLHKASVYIKSELNSGTKITVEFVKV